MTWSYGIDKYIEINYMQDHLAPTMQDLSLIIQPPPWKTLREVVTRFLALFSLVIKLILHNFCLILLLIVLKPSLKEVFLYVQNKQGKLKVVVGKDFIEVAVSYVIHVIIQVSISWLTDLILKELKWIFYLCFFFRKLIIIEIWKEDHSSHILMLE